MTKTETLRNKLEGDPITMTYRNYRGEVDQRTVIPFRIWWGSTDWHPEPGWLMSAHDLAKDADRDFALADCQFAALTPSPEAQVGPAEGAPEWHLSKLLSYIVSDPKQLRGLDDDDALHMEVRLRVGDVRNAYHVVLQSFGSDGTEEARWIADTENACPTCGGSGHKDDAHPPAPQPEAPAAQDQLEVTQEMIDAAFNALPTDAYGTIAAGEMERILSCALSAAGRKEGV